MTTVARYGKAVAHDGQGGALAGHLLGAADDLAADPGCLLYLINRDKSARQQGAGPGSGDPGNLVRWRGVGSRQSYCRVR